MCVCVCIGGGGGGGSGGIEGGRGAVVERKAPKEHSQPQINYWTYYYNDDLFPENVSG